MTDVFVLKFPSRIGYALMPAHETDQDAIKKLPNDQPMRCKITRIRNVDHHRKYFALLNYAFDVWEPPAPSYETMQRACNMGIFVDDVQKNFDRFRADITILAGFYSTTYRLNGEIRIEPKSISFASMGQEEFERLYDKTIDVIVNHVQQLSGYTADKLKEIIDQVMEFEA